MQPDYVNALLDNLDLVLHDQVLEKEGIHLEFYWDTSDVRNALLGQAAYYDYEKTNSGRLEKFNKSRFHGDRALIHCLEGAGWFGPIKLLQPHQVELYKLIDREFEMGSVGPPLGGSNKFLEDVGLAGSRGLNLDQLTKSTPEEVADLIQKQAGSAPTLFKAVQSVRYPGWKSRLIAWVRNKWLHIDDDTYDYRSIISSKEFEPILAAFGMLRKVGISHDRRDANDFSDAVALCQLARKADDFVSGRSRSLPRFFFRSLDQDVITETKLDKHFHYRYEDRDYPIFRNIEYYKLKATLSHTEHQESNPKAALDSLRKTREKLAGIREAQRELAPEALETIIVAGQQLGDILRRLREYWFLEQVWLPFAATSDVMDAIKVYVQDARELKKSPQFHLALEMEVQDIMERLDRESAEYQRFSRFWNDLQKAVRKAVPDEAKDLDLFKTEGLLRFGFSREASVQVEQILAALVSQTFSSRNPSLIKLFRQYQGLNCDSSDDDFMVVGGVLWALRMDEEIVELLLSGSLEDRHYSLSIVFAAASLRQGKNIMRSWQIIQQLSSRYDKADNIATKVDIAIGLGYLYFHYRECMASSPITLDQRQRNEYLQKAVEFAKIASISEPKNLRKIAYATNQYLFYMLNETKMFPLAEITLAAEKLTSLGEDGVDIWQYRFDDTLATYYEYLADVNKSRRRLYLKMAMERMNEACESGSRDKYVIRHREKLMFKAKA